MADETLNFKITVNVEFTKEDLMSVFGYEGKLLDKVWEYVKEHFEKTNSLEKVIDTTYQENYDIIATVAEDIEYVINYQIPDVVPSESESESDGEDDEDREEQSE